MAPSLDSNLDNSPLSGNGKAVCNFCGRRFKNTQSVRAHLKWCQNYSSNSKEEILPKGNVPRSSAFKGQVNEELSGKDIPTYDTDMTQLDVEVENNEPSLHIRPNASHVALLQSHETIGALRERCFWLTWFMKLTSGTQRPEHHADFDEWHQLLNDISAIEQGTGAMFERGRLDHGDLFRLYKDFLDVQERWNRFRREQGFQEVTRKRTLPPDWCSNGNQTTEVKEHEMEQALKNLGFKEEEKLFMEVILRMRALLTRQGRG